MVITYEQSAAFAQLLRAGFTMREAELISGRIPRPALEALIQEKFGLTPDYIKEVTRQHLGLRKKADFWIEYLKAVAYCENEGLLPDRNKILSDALYRHQHPEDKERSKGLGGIVDSAYCLIKHLFGKR